MIKNYITYVWRYVSRNKTFTIINVSGLAIGMMACMLIAEYVLHEFSYDNFHTKKDQIFRVQLDRYNKGEITSQWAAGAAGIGPDLKANFPEVKRYVRMASFPSVFSYGDVFFKEDAPCFATEDFFRVFSFRLIKGVDSIVLKEPFKIVVSETFAKKYFGQEDPVGKVVKNNGQIDYEVTGVYEDLPTTSHMKADVLVSFASLEKLFNNPLTSWDMDGFYTYILLDDKANAAELEAKLPAFVQKKMGEQLKAENTNMVFHLQPIDAIYLDSNFIAEFKPNGDRQSTYFLLTVAILILAIAWINYVNLSTAKSIERAREVGVRKVMGGFRVQLVQQFLFESLVLNVIAVSAALVLVVLFTPLFNELTHRELGYILFKQNTFWLWLGAFIFGGTLLSGLYPSFILSSYKPVDVLKGRFKDTSKGIYFRRGMVVLQFVASITLMVGTYIVFVQINYMRNQKLGVDIEQTLILSAPIVVDSTIQEKYQSFKQSMRQHSEVETVTASTAVPGRASGWNAGGIRRLSQRDEEANQYRIIMTDGDFINSFGIGLMAGRSFSDEVVNEEKNVLLNETAAKLMGFQKPEDAIDDHILFWGDTFRIVGVVNNYRQESLKKAYDPLVFRYNRAPSGFYAIKFRSSDVKRSIAFFEKEWKAIFPGNPFNHFLLSDYYNQQYQDDQQFGKVLGVFSGFAIFVACLGLFGLSSLTAIQRTKEIGVRKVLGASVPGVLTLIGKEYMLLISIAILCAVPLSWWFMNDWLQDFSSRIALAWWHFALPSLVVTMVALFTISFHTLRAASINPANSLRYE